MTNSFEENVILTWGESGKAWLKSLPSIVEHLSSYWNLKKLKPIKKLSFNYVMSGFQDDKAVILKIGCNQKEILEEIIALKAFNGSSCVTLLDSNLEYNAFLLEQAIPGSSLISLYPSKDDEAIEHTSKIIHNLHSAVLPLNSQLPTIKDWFKDLYEPHEKLNKYHINKAQELLDKLLQTQTKTVLLHGDLHHENILLSKRGWIAIDPKGIIGDPAYEICAFIRNPYPNKLKSKKLINHRLQLFSKFLSIDKKRLNEWIYVRAVLEACWTMKDEQANADIAIAEAELFEII